MGEFYYILFLKRFRPATQVSIYYIS